MDSIPVFSQLKSFTQWATGDNDAARRTQENFTKGCPVVSQVRSTIEAISGDTEAAKNTQIAFLQNAEGIVNNTPVIGHIKGAGHYIAGDNERGDEIMKGASRPIRVVSGGIAGFVTGAAVGACVGGVAGAQLMDNVEGEYEHEEYPTK